MYLFIGTSVASERNSLLIDEKIPLKIVFQDLFFHGDVQVNVKALDENLNALESASYNINSSYYGDFEALISPDAIFSEVEARGRHYNWLKGEISEDEIVLKALISPALDNIVYINILSHVEFERKKILINDGLDYLESQNIARSEVSDHLEIGVKDLKSGEAELEFNELSFVATILMQKYSKGSDFQEKLDIASKAIAFKTDSYMKSARKFTSDGRKFSRLRVHFVRPNLKKFGLASSNIFNFERYILGGDKKSIDNYIDRFLESVVLTTDAGGFRLTSMDSPDIEVHVNSHDTDAEEPGGHYLIEAKYIPTLQSKVVTQKFQRRNLSRSIRVYDNGYDGKTQPKEIDWSPHTTALLLLDFFPANYPGSFIISEARKLGIPILHHPHEILKKQGMPSALLPLTRNDYVTERSSKDQISQMEGWNRDLKTVFVLGYGPGLCVLFSRYNSVNHLYDKYPSVKFIPIEEGIDNRRPTAKWAISMYRDFTSTTKATDVLRSFASDSASIERALVQSEKFLTLRGDTAVEGPSEKHRETLKSLKDKSKVIVLLEPLSEKAAVWIDEIQSSDGGGYDVLKIESDNDIFFNGKAVDNGSLSTIRFHDDTVFFIVGGLRNDSPYFRAGFPGDFSCRFSWGKDFCGESVFVTDLLYMNVQQPFADFNYSSVDAINTLITLASNYSKAKWMSSGEFKEVR
jgi:hypothetical protein